MLYVGTGVSGGEEGALKGPSIMPGGTSGRVAADQAHPAGDRREGRAQGGSPAASGSAKEARATTSK